MADFTKTSEPFYTAEVNGGKKTLFLEALQCSRENTLY